MLNFYLRKDFMAMKNPLTPAGIEPATFRYVAQRLNHCATTVPIHLVLYTKMNKHYELYVQHPYSEDCCMTIRVTCTGTPPQLAHSKNDSEVT